MTKKQEPTSAKTVTKKSKLKNRRRSGNEFQRRCVHVLLNDSNCLAVHNQTSQAVQVKTPRGLMWVSKRNDIFGCIDIVALFPTHVDFIQCTLDTNLSRKLKDLQEIKWPVKWPDCAWCRVQVWQGMKDKSIKVFQLQEVQEGVMTLAHAYTYPANLLRYATR